jgi:hypothetical protein
VTRLVVALAAALAAVEPSHYSIQQIGASRVALVIVEDPRVRRPIVDVGADDFVVQEGTETREILSVRPGDYPIVVLVDTGANARGDLPAIRKAVAHFVERIGQRPVAIGTFGDPPAMITSFEDDRRDLTEKLDAIAASESAGSVLLQGAALGARTLTPFKSLFSAIVVVSASATDDSRPNADDLVGPIVNSGAMLHVIANRPARSSPSDPTGSTTATLLRTVVDQTRGQFMTIYTAASYEAALDQLAERLTSELMIEYLVPVQSKAGDVKVGVRMPGVRVRGLGVAPK